jgi:hypothetical protein
MTGDETRLGGLNIWSTAPDRVADVLSGGLGVVLRRRSGRPSGAHYVGQVGGLTISIHTSDQPAVELAFVVPAIEAAIEQCLARGVAVTSRPEPRPYGISAGLLGPDTLRIELVQTAG